MEKWIETDTASISDKRNTNKPAKRVHFMLSPYDVPDAVRALFDEERKQLVIEFRYIPINEKRNIKVNDGVQFEVGVNTQRIYKIFLDEGVDTELVFKTNSSQFIESSLDNAEQAIENFIQYHESFSPNSLKYDAAKSVLHDYKHQLAHAL